MNEEENQDEPAIDWEDRKLCADGNCIGVIGPDGRCMECGRPYVESPGEESGSTGEPVPEGLSEIPEPGVPDGDIFPQEAAAPGRDEPEAGAQEPSDDDWRNRRLCPDGSCIGVIGPDGRCKECGRRYTEAEDASG